MKLLIVSDTHANWPVFRAVLKAELSLDRIPCLGDLVNGPQPTECVAWAKDLHPRWNGLSRVRLTAEATNDSCWRARRPGKSFRFFAEQEE